MACGLQPKYAKTCSGRPFAETGESSAIEFLANGEGAFHFQDLTQNAAGEGEDLSDSSALDAFQQSVIDALEGRVSE